MCNECVVNKIVRVIGLSNSYFYLQTLQCPACREPATYDVAGLSTILLLMITFVTNELNLLDNELSKISRSFFTHRSELEPILNSEIGGPFTDSQQTIIKRFTKFVYKFIGSDFTESAIFDMLKQTRISARWIKESDSTDGTLLLAQVKKNHTEF
jgi:hypothetical protein